MTSHRSSQFSTLLCRFTVATLLLLQVCWAASNGKVLYSFTGGNDGGDPATQLSFDSSGNAYGTTVTGGNFGCGTVFQLTPVGGTWQLNTLYSFTCSDGKNPYGGVILDAFGNLYGTTVAGGSGGVCVGDGCGTVFELTKSGGTWTETVLYNFTGGNDGFGPGGGVAFDSSGNLYGTTPDGGLYSMGVVYQLSPAGGGVWKQSVIHAFTGGTDGGIGSLGTLLYYQTKFFGVTEVGGAHSAGTVFEIFPNSHGGWTFATVYAFQGQPKAASPYGGLIADGQGRLYGTTYFGGASGMGTVFDLALVNNRVQETVIHSFTGGSDGSLLTSTLIFDSLNNLYGTASSGGNPSCSCGTVFEIVPVHGGAQERTLHSFAGTPDGSFPNYGLSSDAKGNFYGTTPTGGAHGQGMVFSFTP